MSVSSTRLSSEKPRRFLINPGLARFINGLLLAALIPHWVAAQNTASSFEDLALRASAAREADDVPRAIELYGQALQLNPKWPEGWWFLGSLQYEADSYAAARDALTRFIDLTPDGGPAFALRGLCEFETGEYTQSLNDLERGLSLGAANQPRDAQILGYHEALLLTRLGSFEGALQKYALLARGSVPNPEALVGIGLAGLRAPLLPKDLSADKQDLFLAAGTAARHFMAGDEKTARQEFQDLFQRFPTAANAHYFYGYLLFPAHPRHAIREFKQELEIAPSNAAAQLMVAWGSLGQNDFPDALICMLRKPPQKIRRFYPSLRLVLGRALVETGDIKGGIEHLEKELRLNPESLETHIALAKAYSEAGRSRMPDGNGCKPCRSSGAGLPRSYTRNLLSGVLVGLACVSAVAQTPKNGPASACVSCRAPPSPRASRRHRWGGLSNYSKLIHSQEQSQTHVSKGRLLLHNRNHRSIRAPTPSPTAKIRSPCRLTGHSGSGAEPGSGREGEASTRAW